MLLTISSSSFYDIDQFFDNIVMFCVCSFQFPVMIIFFYDIDKFLAVDITAKL